MNFLSCNLRLFYLRSNLFYTLFLGDGVRSSDIIFPNPVDEIITLQMNATGTTLTNSSVTEKLKKSDIYEIKVLNEQGTVMKTQKANHLPLNIQTSNLPEGKYIFQVLNNGKSWNKQLLIKH